MANRKISDLTALTAPVSGDLLPIVDISEAAAADKNKKITYSDFLNNIPTGTITSTMILDGTILNADINAGAEIAVNKLADGSARQLLQTDAAGTGVEWTSDVSIPGVLAVTAGTAALPGIAVSGDPNTGIYSPGADHVAISTGGAGRLFVDATGNINLAWGTPRLAAIFDDSFRQGFQFNAASRILNLFSTSNDSGGAITFSTRLGAGSSDTDYGTERARIDSSGRLLVGTSTAVGGYTVQIEADNESDPTGGAVLLRRRLSNATISSAGFQLGTIAAGSQTNVGGFIRFESDAGWGSGDYPTRLVFSTTADGAASPTPRMTIDSSGRLLVGTANAFSGHSFYEATSGIYACYFRQAHSSNPLGVIVNYSGSSPNGTGNAFFEGNDSTTARFVARSNGGLANYQANDVNLSDRNAKKDIAPATGTWDCIKEWEIVNYRYKDQPDDADLNLGVIAQQVAESCPEVITVFEEAKDDQPEKLGVKEQQMYWMAIKALQEAQVRIEQLEQRLTDAGIA